MVGVETPLPPFVLFSLGVSVFGSLWAGFLGSLFGFLAFYLDHLLWFLVFFC